MALKTLKSVEPQFRRTMANHQGLNKATAHVAAGKYVSADPQQRRTIVPGTCDTTISSTDLGIP